MSIERTVFALDRACRNARVEYALVGGVAVAAWGEPRATRDVDALVVLAPENVDALALALRAEGIPVNAREMRSAIGSDAPVPVLDERTGFSLDLRPAQGTQVREVEEAIDVELGAGRLRIVRAEETVASKLSSLPLDLRDARSILARRWGRLDMARLESLAREREAEGVLRELLEDVARGRLS